MKEFYESPKLNVDEFEVEDVLTASTPIDDMDENPEE